MSPFLFPDTADTHFDWRQHGPQVSSELHWWEILVITEGRKGVLSAGGAGTGSRGVQIGHGNWWTQQDKINGSSEGGDRNGVHQTMGPADLSWGGPSKYVDLTLTDALWQDFINSPEGRWVGAHLGDLVRVVGGEADFMIGFSMTFGSGGLAAFPGVGLMALGIDQIVTGEAGLILGTKGPSFVESFAGDAATALGANAATAQTIGAFTPAVLSLVFTVGGSLLEAPVSTVSGGVRVVTGAGEVFATDAQAEAAYNLIRNLTGDVRSIAQNLGIPEDVVRAVRQHLFLDFHDVAVGPGQIARMRFAADPEIAEMWIKAAGSGRLAEGELSTFKDILAHEYVEHSLMKGGGLPFRSADPAA